MMTPLFRYLLSLTEWRWPSKQLKIGPTQQVPSGQAVARKSRRLKNQELRLVMMTSSGRHRGMEIRRGPRVAEEAVAVAAAAEPAEEARECHVEARGASLHINLDGEHIPAEEDRREAMGVAAEAVMAPTAAGGATAAAMAMVVAMRHRDIAAGTMEMADTGIPEAGAAGGGRRWMGRDQRRRRWQQQHRQCWRMGRQGIQRESLWRSKIKQLGE
jgi:hypothetical protein